MRSAKRYGLPILITENGLPDARDRYRAEFIRTAIRGIRRARAEGTEVLGYLHWSLTDNFEWASGLGPRFGLVAIDYATLERKPRRSLAAFEEIIRRGAP